VCLISSVLPDISDVNSISPVKSSASSRLTESLKRESNTIFSLKTTSTMIAVFDLFLLLHITERGNIEGKGGRGEQGGIRKGKGVKEGDGSEK